MFESVQNYIQHDVLAQSENEKIASVKIAKKYSRNIQSLKKLVPSLNEILKNQNYEFDLIINKNGKLNIISKSALSVLYGSNPEKQTQKNVAGFLKTKSKQLKAKELTLVISGIGLGYHLYSLVQDASPKYVIIYEPEMELFKLSAKTAEWFELITLCQTSGIHLFIQLGDNTHSLENDLKELNQAFPNTDTIVFFEHLDYPHLAESIYNYQYKKGIKSATSDTTQVYLPSTVFKITPSDCDDIITSTQQLCFESNMEWLKENEKELYQYLKDYQFQQWQLTKINHVIGLRDQTYRFRSTEYCKEIYGSLVSTDVSTAIAFKYSLSEKRMNNHFAKLFSTINNLKYTLEKPNMTNGFKAKERIVLGSADNNILSDLLKSSSNLIVFEPNMDFLYASLFITPWHLTKCKVLFCTDDKELESIIISEYQNKNFNLIDLYIDLPYYEKKLFEAYQMVMELVQNTNGKTNYFEQELQSLSNFLKNSITARAC